ncbi:MAG: DUF4145 domain-containing protein [Elusimicrobiota bacterium]|nr:DUF4145 domain-containing protein [Elusimicrobiota bacterium]
MMHKFEKRFKELEAFLSEIKNTTYTEQTRKSVDQKKLDEWSIKVKNLILNACGKDSEHYKELSVLDQQKGWIASNVSLLNRIEPVFHAAKDDYINGYLNSAEYLIQAELFDNELEQAKELLKNNYYIAAAVIAGTVLETSLHELCKKNNVIIASLNRMNDDLAKNGIYNSLIHKQIIALAGIRNSAAHGKKDEFTPNQVEDMIQQIEHLLTYNFQFDK